MNNPPSILYVEDEEADVILLRHALERAGVLNPVNWVVDGAQAIDYLAGNPPFADRALHPEPALVLLDINLPKRSGFEVLAWAREQPRFSQVPIILYTSSGQPGDRTKARQLGATDYVIKPSGVGHIVEFARHLAQRWLNDPGSV